MLWSCLFILYTLNGMCKLFAYNRREDEDEEKVCWIKNFK